MAFFFCKSKRAMPFQFFKKYALSLGGGVYCKSLEKSFTTYVFFCNPKRVTYVLSIFREFPIVRGKKPPKVEYDSSMVFYRISPIFFLEELTYPKFFGPRSGARFGAPRAPRALFCILTNLKSALFVVVTSDNKKKARTPRFLSSGNIIHPESQKKIVVVRPFFMI